MPTRSPGRRSDTSETGHFDDSDDLVARNQRKPRVAPIIVDVLDVASRDAAVRDPHQDVPAAERSLITEGLGLPPFSLIAWALICMIFRPRERFG